MEAVLLSIPDKNSQAAIKTQAIIDSLRLKSTQGFTVEHSFCEKEFESPLVTKERPDAEFEEKKAKLERELKKAISKEKKRLILDQIEHLNSTYWQSKTIDNYFSSYPGPKKETT